MKYMTEEDADDFGSVTEFWDRKEREFITGISEVEIETPKKVTPKKVEKNWKETLTATLWNSVPGKERYYFNINLKNLDCDEYTKTFIECNKIFYDIKSQKLTLRQKFDKRLPKNAEEYEVIIVEIEELINNKLAELKKMGKI